MEGTSRTELSSESPPSGNNNSHSGRRPTTTRRQFNFSVQLRAGRAHNVMGLLRCRGIPIIMFSHAAVALPEVGSSNLLLLISVPSSLQAGRQAGTNYVPTLPSGRAAVSAAEQQRATTQPLAVAQRQPATAAGAPAAACRGKPCLLPDSTKGMARLAEEQVNTTIAIQQRDFQAHTARNFELQDVPVVLAATKRASPIRFESASCSSPVKVLIECRRCNNQRETRTTKMAHSAFQN